jgi:ferredoxin
VAVNHRLRLDPIACDGHGLCAELFPEGVWLDDWGYPVITDADVTPDVIDHARRAVAACPVLALRLERRTGEASASDAHGRRVHALGRE